MQGVFKLREERCKGCDICIDFCPTHALTRAKESTGMGVFLPVLDAAKCTYCELCDFLCPDLAITVIKPKKEKTEALAV